MARKHEIPPKLKSAAKRLTPLLVVFVLIVGMLPVFPVSASQAYGHYIYIDGELAFSIMSLDGAPDVQITCKENSVEVYLSDLNSTRSYAISGDGFLGLHIFEDATTPLIPLNTSTVYVGAKGDNKYSYFYTVRGSGGNSGSGGTEVQTYSTYFAVGDDPYYSTDPAAGTCPAITLKVLSDGFQLLNASGSVLKTYTYTGSDVFTGVRLDQDNGLTDVVEKLYSPGESVVCGGVDHSCSFTLSIVTEKPVLLPPEVSIDSDGILYITNSASFVTQYRIYEDEVLLATIAKTGITTRFDLNTLGLASGEKHWITASSGNASNDFSILGTAADPPHFAIWNLTGEVVYIFTGSVYDRFGDTLFGSYAFSGESPSYLTLIVTSEDITIQYGSLSKSWPASDGFLGVYDSNGVFYGIGTHTIEADATSHSLTLDFYTSFASSENNSDYSSFAAFGNFIKTVLGGFLGFSILPGLTFGGLLAVFVVLGIVKLFFSK